MPFQCWTSFDQTSLEAVCSSTVLWWDLVSPAHTRPLTCFPQNQHPVCKLSGSHVGISLQLIPGYPLIVMQLFIALAAPHMHGAQHLPKQWLSYCSLVNLLPSFSANVWHLNVWYHTVFMDLFIEKYVSAIGVDWLLACPIESDIQNFYYYYYYFFTIIGIVFLLADKIN